MSLWLDVLRVESPSSASSACPENSACDTNMVMYTHDYIAKLRHTQVGITDHRQIVKKLTNSAIYQDQRVRWSSTPRATRRATEIAKTNRHGGRPATDEGKL